MAVPLSAERARSRYLNTLYTVALLRDPQPQRAARAVVAAFTSLDWDGVEVDERLEARLVSQLPRVRRFPLRDAAPKGSSLAAIAPEFWRLPAKTRLALALRLLRGMSTAHIADALRCPLPEAQSLLLDGIAPINGERSKPSAECQACLVAWLDDPVATRRHVRDCGACRDVLARWEQAEAMLAEQLRRAAGNLTAPPRLEEAVRRALDKDLDSTPLRGVLRPWKLQLGLAIVVAAFVAGFIYGVPGSVRNGGTAVSRAGLAVGQAEQVLSPHELLDRARGALMAPPNTGGILHRRWEVTLDQPPRLLQAAEWVYAKQPAMHRMQLLEGKQLREWQAGDGAGQFRYMSTLSSSFCGPSSVDVDSGGINQWRMPVEAQQRMRAARWQSGPWSTGRWYLDQASRADTLRSLGVSGSGGARLQTLAAEGRAISGTLLLRVDPQTSELREVRELRTKNGRTESRTRWRMLTRETVDTAIAVKQNLLIDYPDINRPGEFHRTAPVIDPSCPLLGTEQAVSLLRLLANAFGSGPIGLPAPPVDIDAALYISGMSALSSQIIYVGPGKRLVLLPEQVTGTSDGTKITAGPWTMVMKDGPLGVITAQVWSSTVQPSPRPGNSTSRFFSVWATGWSQDELVDVVRTVRPLRLEDWARNPKLFFDPQPLDAAALAHLPRLVLANLPRAGQTLHRTITTTVRQPDFFATLDDPYHLPAEAWPATRRVEVWSELDEMGLPRRWRWNEEGARGNLLKTGWNDGLLPRSYEAVSNVVISNTVPFAHGYRFPGGFILEWLATEADALELINGVGWIWTALEDGGIAAERVDRYWPMNRVNDARNPDILDRWTQDLKPRFNRIRLEFDGGGKLRRKETFALVDLNPNAPGAALPDGNERVIPTPPPESVRAVLIDRSVVETSEWLPAVPAATFSFAPPADAVEVDRDSDLPDTGPYRIASSAADAAATFGSKVWAWPDGKLGITFHSGIVPPAIELQRQPRPATLISAVASGRAMELRYTGPDSARLSIRQGHVAALRPLMARAAPEWTQSSKIEAPFRGRTQEAWTMSNGFEGRHWLVLELDQTLVILDYNGTAAGWATLLQHLDELQSIEPAPGS